MLFQINVHVTLNWLHLARNMSKGPQITLSKEAFGGMDGQATDSCQLEFTAHVQGYPLPSHVLILLYSCSEFVFNHTSNREENTEVITGEYDLNKQ